MTDSGETGPGEGAEPDLVCTSCGAVPEDPSTARLTWSRGTENNRDILTCERCSRENLRSIESKLDSPWW